MNLVYHLSRHLRRYFWVSDSALMSKQRAVYRVNCIDCLDRTNVVQVSDVRKKQSDAHEFGQSAFARHVLNRQLGAVALFNEVEVGKSESEVVFNDGD